MTSYDVSSDICQALPPGEQLPVGGLQAQRHERAAHRAAHVKGGGFHSSTSQLNLRRLCH